MSEQEFVPRGFHAPGQLLVLIFVAVLAFFSAGVVEDRTERARPVDRRDREPNFGVTMAIWLAAGGILLWAGSAPPAPRPRPATAKPRHPLCAHCFTPYFDGAHFCPTCARPLTFFASTGGYEQIYAQAWVLGKAVSFPSRPLHPWTLTAFAAASVMSPPVALLSELAWDWRDFLYWAQHVDLSDQLFLLASMCLNGGIWWAFAIRSWSRWNARLRGDEGVPPESSYGSPPYWSHDAQWAVPPSPAYDESDDFLTEPDGATDDDT